MSYLDYLDKARDIANKVYDQGVVALSKTETERRLAEALSHANWGASSTLLGELAESTNDYTEYAVIMKETWAAIASTGYNWRVAYKGLALLEFLLRNGNKRVIQEARDNIAKLRYLLGFSYVKDGTERGMGVREKAKAVLDLLEDDDLLKQARKEAKILRQKFKGVGRDEIHTSSSSSRGGGNPFHQTAEDDDEDIPSSKPKKYDDDFDFKKKPSSKKPSAAAEDDFGFEPKAKQTEKEEDDDDFDFAPGVSKPASAKKPVAAVVKKAAPPPDEDDFDFEPTAKPTAASAKKPAALPVADDDDFGFDDRPAPAVVKPGPIASISVKLPGVAASKKPAALSSSGGGLAAPPSASQQQTSKEIDLMMDAFDPFQSGAKPQAKPQPASSTANIMDLFNSPPATTAPSTFGFPQQQQPMMGQSNFGAFPPMQYQQQQPPMQYQQQQPPMQGFPQQQQQPPMQGFPQQQQQPPMQGFPQFPQQQPPMHFQQQPPMQFQQQPPMQFQQQPPMQYQQQQQQPRQQQQPTSAGKSKPNNDAFSGLMDFSKGGSLI